ncbi:MAG: hypothetical protein ACI8P3_003767 [Saprospiraceae bacterium]|jgi:hypothetical protein
MYIRTNIEVPKSKAPIYIVVDSRGLNVYGDGEWKTRKHRISKRRTWQKLHLGGDEKTGLIHAQGLTEKGKGAGDAQQSGTLHTNRETNAVKRIHGFASSI